jgi:aminotransferase
VLFEEGELNVELEVEGEEEEEEAKAGEEDGAKVGAQEGGALTLTSSSSVTLHTLTNHGYDVNPDHLVITEGVTSALDALSFVLSNPGDVWLTPAPFYVSYVRDLQTRSNVDVWPVRPIIVDQVDQITSLPQPSDFEGAYIRCKAAGKKVSAVLICNPSNPSGCCAKQSELVAILKWSRMRDVHVVVDEIFAGTTFGTTPCSPKQQKEEENQQELKEESVFKSVLTLNARLGSKVTVLWGCAKEMGLGGWHLGCLLPESKRLHQALCRIVRISGCPSNPIQDQLAGVLEDRRFIQEYSTSNANILKAGCADVVKACDNLGFSYVPASAGLFVMIRLVTLMKETTYANERALFRHMFTECNVVMSPGEGSMAPPGWFRCCYACAPEGAVEEAFSRIAKLKREDIVVTEEDISGSKITEEAMRNFFF